MDAQDMPPASSQVSSGEERREYFRVDDTLPLDYEPVSREEAERHKEGARADEGLLRGGMDLSGADPGLLKLLKSIDHKLNCIMEAMRRKDIPVDVPGPKEVNISAGGVRFRCEKEFRKGDILRITLGLPPYPYEVMSVLGEVVRVEKCVEDDCAFYGTAVRFLDIEDDRREDIIKYLFKVQRDIITKKTGTES